MIAVNLIANTDLKTAEEFRNLVIREKDNAIVRLGDVADISLGAESYEEDVRFSGQKATFMGVWPLPSANTLDVVRAVREALPDIQSAPAGRDECERRVRFDRRISKAPSTTCSRRSRKRSSSLSS